MMAPREASLGKLNYSARTSMSFRLQRNAAAAAAGNTCFQQMCSFGSAGPFESLISWLCQFSYARCSHHIVAITPWLKPFFKFFLQLLFLTSVCAAAGTHAY